MDHMKVLKRAWETTWRYRALWVFGIILALTTANFGRGGDQARYEVSGEDFPAPGGRLPLPEVPTQILSILAAVGIGLACLVILIAIAFAIARYVSETALIRMVDDHEQTGETRSVRQGFRLGWSRTAWRIFLINLLIDLPVVVAFILLFVLALLPLFLWTTDSTVAGVTGTVATIGMVLLLILLLIVVSAVLSLLKPFFRRACALEGLGVIKSIRQGLDVVRRHWKDAGIMWLIMVGLGIGWTIAMIMVVLFLIVAGVGVGGLPALLVGGLASLVFEDPLPWILAGVVGAPIFILVIAAPLLFLGGLAEVFKSSVWTLTYRELLALESLEIEGPEAIAPEPLPEPGSDAPQPA
jgi:hypothetical protein